MNYRTELSNRVPVPLTRNLKNQAQADFLILVARENTLSCAALSLVFQSPRRRLLILIVVLILVVHNEMVPWANRPATGRAQLTVRGAEALAQ